MANSSQSQQCAEIGVSRDENSALRFGQVEDRAVVRCLEPIVAYVCSLVARAIQAVRQHRRERVIDEKLQGIASGNSRSRSASAA